MKAVKAVVFDLYGTLYDVHSVAGRCGERFPGRGLEISLLWRQKQLEYTWLRTLMGQYIPFEEATEHALDYVAAHLKLNLSSEAHAELCNEYLRLRPYPEADAALTALRARGLPLAILSNGSVFSIHSVVEHSRLEHQFDYLISVETVKLFKPHTSVYELAEKTLGFARDEILFVSSNSWDASGARHFGYQVCWVNRLGSTFDRLGQTPHYTVASLDDLPERIQAVAVAS
ncbi:haloacid dehalogenase type II [Paraburkholderia sp. SARCC-3016]|uniref:haloacid dehalogenase type II n=1 Tax=Paraburkholderia sp. SARCC-3016 TaxID=3058611 RepID=UPI0028085745|nr:haloacid dehalogenase type II [Paraburkholderia sp. SARCC-3016]MDQ7981679.1 haloacid dehalogenase type II [Paraburkholderia sp. SARCC-3016]